MERLKKLIYERLSHHQLTEDQILNLAREYLQVLTLKVIFQSPHGAALSFMGGTCLRICYDLKRYSEDLDFCLDGEIKNYDFSKMIEHVKKEMGHLGFSVSTNTHPEKNVQKSFLHIAHLPQILNLRSFRREQKLHIKIEVDQTAISLKDNERESHFVNRCGEIYPILKHTLPTLFAGKVLALLGRPYDRGRDYYDLIWYLSRQTSLNVDYINRTLKSKKKAYRNQEELFQKISEKVKAVIPQLILKDIEHFLEDPSERNWILRYQEVYSQLQSE
ncbi:MAG: nucleotidyl transferase AbiEii/AbiGii toxin family protein [Deltaproteobacteria bacterium]|nr:nucleotidyl transferase AbiEii/AbiGii toxin family protein [Deltaproteobacteria bacterium]